MGKPHGELCVCAYCMDKAKRQWQRMHPRLEAR